MLTKRRHDLRIVAGLAIAWLGACNGQTRVEPPPAVVAGREPPIVEFAGCSGATKPPQELRCTLPAAPSVMHLFVSATSVPVIEIDGTPAKAHTTPTIAELGWTVAVEVPPTATVLSVRYADAQAADAAWTMAFARIAPTPTVDAIEFALPPINSPGRTPALVKASAELERVAPGLAVDERHAALRVAMVLALMSGDPERAVALGQRALREALSENRLFHVIEIGEVLLHSTTDDAEKETLLRLLEVSIELTGDVQHAVRLLYARGYRAHQRGDIGAALDDYEKSEREARRLGLRSDELVAAAQRTGLLAMTGDNRASDKGRERILSLVIGRPPSEACTDAQVLFGAAWNLLSRRLLGDRDADPKPVLDRIERYFDKGGGCDVGDDPMLLHALRELQVDIAREALTRSDFDACRAALARIDRASLTAGQRRWTAYVDAELALHAGDPATALRTTEGLSEEAVDQPLLAWKTALLRSDARLVQNDRAGALSEALLAEGALDRAAGQLAPDQGREGMAAAFHVSAARAIELQLEKGYVDGAVLTARRARARRLRPVGSASTIASLRPDARARYHAARRQYRRASLELEDSLTRAWRLATDERARASQKHAELQEQMRSALKNADAALRDATQAATPSIAPTPGELTLLYHPLTTGWVAFAITEHQVEVHRFALAANMTDDAASQSLLRPFASAIASAERLRILAVADLVSTRVHTLPWEGQPLVFTKPVAYGLDLGGSSVAPLGTRTALVVADPATRIEGLGRLPKAAAEGAHVQARLQTLGWEVVSLAEDAAEHNDVVAALERADWLHYAGHGVAGGRSGWDSALPLAGESALDVRDIMSMPRVPRAVVLSACDTAGAAHDGAGMQVATAFLLAGAEFVVAAQGGVSDDAASRFSAALYDEFGDDLRGPELARRAILSLSESGEPMSTWSGFHVWVR